MWINQIKVFTAFVAFIIAMYFSDQIASVNLLVLSYLFLSGFMGLCVGDIFLFRAFTTLGPARSLVLYSFQPLMLGLYGYFFLAQIFRSQQFGDVVHGGFE